MVVLAQSPIPQRHTCAAMATAGSTPWTDHAIASHEGRRRIEVQNELSLPVVVVDTTTIFDDLRLTHTHWIQLLTLCAKNEIRLIVPEVVLREAVRHWKKQGDQALKNAHDEIKKLAGFGLEAGEGPPADLIDVDTHEQYVRARLEKVGAELPKLPASGTPEKLLERDLGGRKPFASSGKGFRDALNWETILELAAESQVGQIYWVSKNSNDFGDGKGALHPDLADELRDPTQVIWVLTLVDLFKRSEFAALLAGLAASEAELEHYLSSSLITTGTESSPKTTAGFIRDALVDAAERLLGESIEGAYESYDDGGPFGELDLPSEVTEMTIDYVQADPDTVQWDVYESFDDTTLLVAGEIVASLTFEGFADKFDAVHADTLEIRDFDWNDHVSQVAFSRNAVLKFQLRVEEGVGVEYVDFEGAGPA